MVFGTDPFLKQARLLMEVGDTSSLRYACLELRFALEYIAYQKLQLRLDKVTLEEIGGWQPKRAMDRLMELVDEHLGGDFVISMARETDAGAPFDKAFFHVGTTKGINPRDLGKHWQKLSSYLHATMPKKKGDHPKDPDPRVLQAYLIEVIDYVELLTSTRFDAHFTSVVTFKCGECNQSIVRNSNLLKAGDTVRCQNPNCTEVYKVQIEQGEISFTRYPFEFTCDTCKTLNDVKPNPLVTLKTNQTSTIPCSKCSEKYEAYWVLTLKRAEKTNSQDDTAT